MHYLLEDDAMAATSVQIETLVLRMQGAFLETPRLNLRLSVAKKRFGVDQATCEAVLAALVDANVLTKTPQGAYVRHFPQRAARRRVVVSGLGAQRPRRLARQAA
jgi:hypothetical protein